MKAANEIQVGGSHYKSGYEHWDFAINVAMDYLSSAASKYVVRWRDKNGIEDLEKAAHYITKLIEVSSLVLLRLQHCRPYMGYIEAETVRFIRTNRLNLKEAQVCHKLATWTTKDELESARELILELVNSTKLEQVKEKARKDTVLKKTILEDSNKHAERE